jgi:hypothetical protein
VQAGADAAAVSTAAAAMMGLEMGSLASGHARGDAILRGVRLEELGGAEGGKQSEGGSAGNFALQAA